MPLYPAAERAVNVLKPYFESVVLSDRSQVRGAWIAIQGTEPPLGLVLIIINMLTNHPWCRTCWRTRISRRPCWPWSGTRSCRLISRCG